MDYSGNGFLSICADLFSQVMSHLVLLTTCLRAGREAGSHLLQRGRGQGFTGLIQSPIQFLEGEPGETHLPHTSLEATLKEQGQKETLRRSLWGEDTVTCHLSLTTASSCGTVTKCVRVLSSWDAELAANCIELRDWEKLSYVTGRKASNVKDALTF